MELTKIDTKKSFYGPVPSDWVTCEFQDVLTGFSSGMTPYRGIPEYYKGNIPWITSGELNYNIITDTYEKITQDAVIKTNLKVLPVGTFLMAITGLEAAGTRGSCGITGVKATTNQSCMALFPKEGQVDTRYLYHFYVMYGNELAFKFCQGSKQQSYTGRIAKILPINLPPNLAEQKAIATALSDVDDLISNLDKLISKKKAIKQGAMQQLLTPPHNGGNRLAGFTEEWIEKKLGEISEIYQPVTISQEKFSTAGYPVYGANGIVGYYTSYNHKLWQTAITCRGSTCGTVNRTVNECWITGNAMVMNVDNQSSLNKEFFFHLLSNQNFHTCITGSGQPQIVRQPLFDYEVSFPKEISEQIEIANILSDMDIELEQLEIKKAKYQDIKQGMMQELLTGKTRLI